MSVIGTWDVTITTPLGAQHIVLDFTDEQTGVARFGTDSVALQNVSVSGNTASCNATLTQPMSVTLTCTVTVDGDDLAGTASAGFFGNFALSGRRTSA